MKLKKQLFGIIIIFVISCTNTEKEISFEKGYLNINQNKTTTTIQKGAPDDLSESNPDLLNNWESLTQVVLNGGGYVVDAPWYFKQGNNINIPQYYGIDIKKDDGWKLIFHTLISKNSGDANYIIFYNKPRGIIKVFYYNDQANFNNNFHWLISANQVSKNIPSNTDFSEPIEGNKFQNATSNNIVNPYSNDINFSSLSFGWNAFEFELPYSDIPETNTTYSLTGYASLTADITLNGKYSGKVNIPNGFTGANQFFNDMNNDVKTISTVFGSTINIASVFVAPEVKSIVTLGKIVKIIGGISGIMGSANAVFNKNTEPTYITAESKGDINLNGYSISPQTGSVKVINSLDIKKLNGGVELGLWSLQSKPTLKLSRYLYDNYSKIESYQGQKYVIDSISTDSYGNSLTNFSIKVNPEILSQIESIQPNCIMWHISKATKINGPRYGKDLLSTGKYLQYSSIKLLNPSIDNNLNNSDWHIVLAKNPQDIKPSSYSKILHIIDRKTVYKNLLNYVPNEIYLTVSLLVKYKNGQTFISSRNFVCNLEFVNNDNIIKSLIPNFNSNSLAPIYNPSTTTAVVMVNPQ